MRLKGRKVALREKRLEDAEAIHRWRSDPEIARLDAAPPLNLSFEEFLPLFEEELRDRSPRRCRFAIETREGVLIGTATYYDIDRLRRQTQLGIIIGERDYWSRGYGTDAVGTLLRHIFTETDLERVYLYTLVWNVRAQRAFQKCGFVECSRASDGQHQFVQMEIRRSDWLRNEAQRRSREAKSEAYPFGESPSA